MAKPKNGLHIDKTGTKSWYLNGKLHRQDGPAVEWTNGGKFWYVDGMPHREDGPAKLWPDGNASWYRYGKYLGSGAEGFWAHWALLTHEQRNNLDLHKWLAKYSGYEVDTRDILSPE